jgi:hypothetical protein
MNISNRINKLEKQAQKQQDRMDINSVIWADGPPMAETIEEWETFVRWQQGHSDGSGLRAEYRQACEAFFERQKLGRIYKRI